MISEERLQELIDQKATIWAECYGEIQLCDESKICYDEFLKTVLYYLSGFMHGGKFVNDGIMPNFLEENVEKGKWCYEMHVSRIERFDPPVWEDFLESEEYIFWTKKHKQTHIMTLGAKYLVVETDFERFYTGDLTKENYLEACKIAKKLFLG